jgi:uncharacterized phage protein gp47/JayE
MPWITPTLPELVEMARRQFRTELPGSDAWVWPNNINVSAKVMGAMSHENHLWLDYIAKQRFVSEADGEFLDRHGFIYGLPRLPPTFARGTITYTGVPLATIPAGIPITVDDWPFATTSPGTVSAEGTVDLDVQATIAGAGGNALGGTAVSLDQAVPGLGETGVVSAAGIGLGADEEGDEAYRARLLFRLRMPPHGGAAHDYIAWAREVSAAITRVFVDPLSNGPGTVSVYFLMDDTYTNGIPQAADVEAVAEYIDVVRPATAFVQVLAPIPIEIDVTVDNLVPDTTAVRSSILLELQDLFRREGAVSRESAPFTMYRSKIWAAIANATGEDHHTLVTPASDTLLNTGELAVLGELAYT